MSKNNYGPFGEVIVARGEAAIALALKEGRRLGHFAVGEFSACPSITPEQADQIAAIVGEADAIYLAHLGTSIEYLAVGQLRAGYRAADGRREVNWGITTQAAMDLLPEAGAEWNWPLWSLFPDSLRAWALLND